MKITPRSEEEIRLASLWPEGEYDFEIAAATEKLSSSSNPMIELACRVFNGGGERMVKDWLLEKVEYKLRHFAFAIGLGVAYENGDLDATLMVGRAGRLKLGIEKAKGDFPPKNKVVDYIVADAAKDQASAAKKPAAIVPRATVAADEPPF